MEKDHTTEKLSQPTSTTLLSTYPSYSRKPPPCHIAYVVPITAAAGLCLNADASPGLLDLMDSARAFTARKWYRTIMPIMRVPRNMASECNCPSEIILEYNGFGTVRRIGGREEVGGGGGVRRKG